MQVAMHGAGAGGRCREQVQGAGVGSSIVGSSIVGSSRSSIVGSSRVAAHTHPRAITTCRHHASTPSHFTADTPHVQHHHHTLTTTFNTFCTTPRLVQPSPYTRHVLVTHTSYTPLIRTSVPNCVCPSLPQVPAPPIPPQPKQSPIYTCPILPASLQLGNLFATLCWSVVVEQLGLHSAFIYADVLFTFASLPLLLVALRACARHAKTGACVGLFRTAPLLPGGAVASDALRSVELPRAETQPSVAK